MEYGFSGYLTEPEHIYNGLGILIIDNENKRDTLSIRLAQIGAMAIALDLHPGEAHRESITHIHNALAALYRLNAKLAIMTFAKSSLYIPDILALDSDIDMLFAFDPHIPFVSMQAIPERYLFIKNHTQKQYKDVDITAKHIVYDPEEIYILDKPIGHVLEPNALWNAIATVVQYA